MLPPLVALLLCYVGICLFMYVFQDRFVFRPLREHEATPELAGLAYEDLWLTSTDGTRIHGWFLPHPEARGVCLFLHGNAGNVSHRLDTFEQWHGLGMELLIIDYRGYGLSEGRPDEAGMEADAMAAWEYLVEERGVEPARIVIFGRSLGGALAAALAERVHPAGLVLESTFTRFTDMARRSYPWLPARRLSRYRFDTLGRLPRIDCPILVAHSPGDELIPYAMGRRLHEVAGPSARFLEMRGDHNYGYLNSNPEYIEGLDAFLSDVLPSASSVETGRPVLRVAD